MRFHLDSDQVAIQDAVAGTLAQVFGRDRLMSFIDDAADNDPVSWQALMALGVGGLLVPEKEGGLGLGLFEAALILEAIGAQAAPGPFLDQLLTTRACYLSDNEAVQEILPDVMAGTTIACLAVDENWLPENWSIRMENGCVTGEARFVACADAATVFLAGTAGGGLALVAKSKAVSIERLASTDRTRPVSKVSFSAAPAALVLEAGDDRVQQIFDAALVLVAADCLGGAQHCVNLSVDYAQERKQFGQVIGRFQALKHQLATMSLGLEPARSLVWYAAYAWDQSQADGSRSAALAKAHLCDRFSEITRDAIAAHGGIGYTWEYGLNIWFRRSVFNRSILGAPAIHRARAADMAGW